MKRTRSDSLIRSRLTLAVVAALAMAPAFAQDTPPPADEAEELEVVVVTGTRKPGLSPTESISPIDVFSGAQLENQATADLTDSLTKIAPSLNTQRFPIADGTAFVRPVSLRNLAPDQTLVLVNGTRRHRSALVNLQLAPLGTVNQGTQAVDFSAIPANAVKRVEVLRDGASSQYGSDAIAGVVNVILDDRNDGANVSAQYGEYEEGDGERYIIGADAGFALGEKGFIRISAERADSEITSRGKPRTDVVPIAEIVGADLVPYNGFGQRWGDPDVEANKFFINAGFDISDSVALYGFGSYMDNETLGGFFYRSPVLPPEFGIGARTTLQIDNNGDFLPDNAPQSLVNQITGAGLNPNDYLTANGASPSGFVLLNPIYPTFPGGYSPLFGADIEDYEFVGGLRGGVGTNFKWDFHGRTGQNEISYVLDQSINPSLGRLSPTSFRPGDLTQEESEVGIDFVQTFDSNSLNLAYGALWRNETYTIGQGDLGSTQVGPTAAVFGVGSDGFQGFFPESAGEFEQDSYAAYVDLETQFNEKWSGAAALRYENADDFDSEVVWKLSTRYQFNDAFAMRATYNTGFRTPTPGQLNTLNVTTTADSSGNLIPSGTYPVSNPVALALGAVPVDAEESQAFTLGFAWDPADNVTMTFDYYNIQIDDRIGLVSKTVTQSVVDTLNANGYPNAQLLLGSAASYFSNAFGSEVEGIDFVIDTRHELWNGMLNVDFRYNHNTQDVVDVVPGTINADRKYDLENQVPEDRAALTFDYAKGGWGGLIRFNYYGDWSTTGGLFGNGDASDAVGYGSNTLVDLEARYRWSMFTFVVGGDNVFDQKPDREKNGTLDFLGVKYAVTSPFGFNGAFWYARVSVDF